MTTSADQNLHRAVHKIRKVVSQHGLQCDLENRWQLMKCLYLRNFPFC